MRSTMPAADQVDDPLTSTDRAPVVDEPVRPRHVRLPSDLLRLLVATVVGGLGLLIAALLDDTSAGFTIEVVDAAEAVPDPVVVVGILSVQLVAVMVPVVAVAVLLIRRTYRRLALAALAVVLAAAAAWAFENSVLERVAFDLTAIGDPSWICEDGETGGACVPAGGFPNVVYLAGFAAGFSALAPWLGRRWRQASVVLLGCFVVVRTLAGIVAPMEALIVVALGGAVGAAVVLTFGATDPRPTGAEVVDALERHGVGVRRVAAADVPARNSQSWFATTTEGTRLFVKVLGPEERAADLLYRAVRAIRLKDTGDAPPFLTVRREVEHEAVLSLTAWTEGIRTPRLVAAGQVGVNSMMLAFEAVEGRPLDEVGAVDDRTVRGMWREVAALHRRRVAHRNLSRSNVLVDADGDPWITDFGFGELAAGETQLDADVSQLLTATALSVGAERAVAAAVAAVGSERVGRAAPRLQPAALGSSTRSALGEQPDLLDELRDEVAAVTGAEPVELERIERVSARSVLIVAMLGIAFYLLIPQLAQVRWEDIREANWAWFPLVVFFSFATYLGATVALLGSVPDRVAVVPTFEAQIGGSFVNRITPVKVGGMATNVRYLQRAGVDPAAAVAGIGIASVVGFVVHMTLLVVFVTTAGRSAADSFDLPSASTVLVGLVVVMTLAGIVMLLPFGRRLLARLWPIVKRSLAGLGNVAARPRKILALVVGSFVVTTSYMLALWYSVVAFGGGIGFVAVGAVYLAGQAVAQAAPTPGGIGAAEAALIAGLTTFGLAAEVAVPAVFLYRFATFWLPILPGWIAVRHLLRVGAL